MIVLTKQKKYSKERRKKKRVDKTWKWFFKKEKRGQKKVFLNSHANQKIKSHVSMWEISWFGPHGDRAAMCLNGQTKYTLRLNGQKWVKVLPGRNKQKTFYNWSNYRKRGGKQKTCLEREGRKNGQAILVFCYIKKWKKSCHQKNRNF